MTSTLLQIPAASWDMLVQAAPYVLLGLLVGGLLRVFLSPASVAAHLGQGRLGPVFKAALLGIPLPLCSCGVLPAAASLKRQGANNGAVTAFLISTPESGVDSISITWALLDPVMTVARPVAAFLSAMVAGGLENLLNPPAPGPPPRPDLTCPIDQCCDGQDCPPEEHRRHHGMGEKLLSGLRYACGELWADLAGWFFLGILLAGIITVLVPDELMMRYLGGGLGSMLLMLAVGIPLYICATASTPIAAAFILKGVSPGAALVFLLVGPATNVTSLTVLTGLLGRRATALYLGSIAVVSVLCGLVVDLAYQSLGIQARAAVGQAAEVLPAWLSLGSALLLLALSVRPLWAMVRSPASRGCDDACCGGGDGHHVHEPGSPEDSSGLVLHGQSCSRGGSCQDEGAVPAASSTVQQSGHGQASAPASPASPAAPFPADQIQDLRRHEDP